MFKNNFTKDKMRNLKLNYFSFYLNLCNTFYFFSIKQFKFDREYIHEIFNLYIYNYLKSNIITKSN